MKLIHVHSNQRAHSREPGESEWNTATTLITKHSEQEFYRVEKTTEWACARFKHTHHKLLFVHICSDIYALGLVSMSAQIGGTKIKSLFFFCKSEGVLPALLKKWGYYGCHARGSRGINSFARHCVGVTHISSGWNLSKIYLHIFKFAELLGFIENYKWDFTSMSRSCSSNEHTYYQVKKNFFPLLTSPRDITVIFAVCSVREEKLQQKAVVFRLIESSLCLKGA